MRVLLAGVGRLKAGPERELFERYVGRAKSMARGVGIAGVEVLEVDEGRGRTAGERKREEASALSAKLLPATYIVVFDERGGALTSEAFAALIGRIRDAAAPALALIVGGPDGFDDAFRRRADLSMSFGSATLPHQLVRILAAEQMYRALTILTGHPYHRA